MAICSFRISLTVKGTITRPVFRKKQSISESASCSSPSDVKGPASLRRSRRDYGSRGLARHSVSPGGPVPNHVLNEHCSDAPDVLDGQAITIDACAHLE